MFMIVSYPWPVPFAHARLDGRHPGGSGDTTANPRPHARPADHAEELVSWTALERARFSW